MKTENVRDLWNDLGHDLFDEFSDFETWLNTRNFFFDGKKPIYSKESFLREKLTAMQYGDNI